MEEYKDIKGYEGKYQISDTGKVYSVHSGKTLKTVPNKNYGYHQVMLWSNSTVKLHYVHRLVAEAFVENPDNHKIVTHINGDKDDNTAGNLMWVKKAVHRRKQKSVKNNPWKDKDILVRVIEEINREKRERENGKEKSK